MPPRPRPALASIVRSPFPSADRRDALCLDMNENPLEEAADIGDLLGGLDPFYLPHYASPDAFLERLGERLGLPVECLTLGAGTEGIIKNAFEAYVDRGAGVVALDPGFAMIPIYARVYEADLRLARYGADLDLPPERIIEAGRGAALVVLSNPNNPTGTVLSVDEVRRILDALPDALVLVDEAYHPFSGVTLLGEVPRRPNLLVARSFSKAWGLAGLRLGYAAGPPEAIAALRKTQQGFPVGSLPLAVAAAALDRPERLARSVERILAGRARLARGLEGRGVAVREGSANFVLAHLDGRARDLVEGLRRRGILVRGLGPPLDGWVRITAGSVEQMDRVLEALDAVLG